MRSLIAAAAFVSLVACAQPTPVVIRHVFTPQSIHADKGCRTDEDAMQCELRQRQEFANLSPAEVQRQRASLEDLRAVGTINAARDAAEYRARAECSYKAQEANSMSWGLVHGFFAGLGTGSACINYYRDIGVIR